MNVASVAADDRAGLDRDDGFPACSAATDAGAGAVATPNVGKPLNRAASGADGDAGN